jgi:predicted lipase
MHAWLFLVALLCYTPLFTAMNIQTANTSVFLSAQAYCDKSIYNTMTMTGPAAGFSVKSVFHDTLSDMQGYVGILPSTQTTYVVFRGSSSVRNWIDDFEVTKTPYTSFSGKCANCTVHKGFYAMTQRLFSSILSAVSSIASTYHSAHIVVTGHSEGAAVAHLTCMEFQAANIDCDLYNFGQPRVGDANYASFANQMVRDLWRFTHNRDIVPHVPPMEVMDYYHSCGEIFEDASGKLTQCSVIECEDAACADQYALKDTDVDDHLIYLGHPLDCIA